MIRTLIALSALASVSALALPASAEPSAVVSVAGKSPSQVYGAVVDAARALCQGATAGDIHGIHADACVAEVVKTTFAARPDLSPSTR